MPHNGTTFDTSVTVTGKASPGQTVQLYDGATAVAPVTNVNANGDWSKTFTGLSVAPHNIKARALYGSQLESAVRIFTVRQRLTVDPSTLILNGRNYTIAGTGLNWVTTGNDPAGTAGRKTVSGGQPPYTFKSSSPTIASVDNTGLVRSEGNGIATIIVEDSAQNSVTFSVQTSNVRQILVNHQQHSAAQAAAWISSMGATQIDSGAGWQSFSTVVRTKYTRGPGFVTEHYFTGGKNGNNSYHVSAVAHNTHPEGWIYLTFSAIATLKVICEK